MTLFKKKSNLLQDDADEDVNDDQIDDLIELNGLDMVGFWRFPNVNRCPTKQCSAVFKSRSDILAHYRNKHAPNSFLCSLCEKPIYALSLSQALKHFQSAHANVEIPPEFKALISNVDEDDMIELKGGNLRNLRQLAGI